MSDAGLARLVTSRTRDVPDFPRAGVLFRDLGPLLRDPEAMTAVLTAWRARYTGRVDLVAGIEARGFALGAVLAAGLGVGFVPIRKAGKLPGPVLRADYDLEYGSAALELQTDAVAAGERVLLVDDVLATGGTAAAGADLITRLGAEVVAVVVVLELADLGGRRALPGITLDALATL